MGKLKTPEQLQQQFQNLKEKKQKQKEKQSQQKKTKLQQDYKNVNKTLQQEKKEKADKIIKEHQQWLQTTLKQQNKQRNIIIPTTTGDFNEEKLYKTKEELQQWEQQHYQCINWPKFEQIVRDFHKQ